MPPHTAVPAVHHAHHIHAHRHMIFHVCEWLLGLIKGGPHLHRIVRLLGCLHPLCQLVNGGGSHLTVGPALLYHVIPRLCLVRRNRPCHRESRQCEYCHKTYERRSDGSLCHGMLLLFCSLKQLVSSFHRKVTMWRADISFNPGLALLLLLLAFLS